MSGQQHGPVPETTPDGAAAPAPGTWPATGPAAAPHDAAPEDAGQDYAGQDYAGQDYAGPRDAGQDYAGQPARAAAGWGAPGWGAPPQVPAGPAQGWGAARAPRPGSSAAKPWTLKRGLVVAGAAGGRDAAPGKAIRGKAVRGRALRTGPALRKALAAGAGKCRSVSCRRTGRQGIDPERCAGREHHGGTGDDESALERPGFHG